MRRVDVMDVEQAIIRGFSEACAKLQALMAAEEKLFHHNLSPSEVHCIVMIDRLDCPNVTELAKALHMTPGGVSKLTARLAGMKAIERFHKEYNKKEVFFRLTPLGEAIKTQHEALRRMRVERDRPVYREMSEEEKECLLRFIHRYNKHLDRELEKVLSRDNGVSPHGK